MAPGTAYACPFVVKPNVPFEPPNPVNQVAKLLAVPVRVKLESTLETP